MSVKVNNLSKQYGNQLAVNNVSFEANPGDILGFLGPNGAGKTTTMKILTSYVPPTEGTAQIAGYDVTQHPHEVRKLIGYLPENNPLYLDMYVKEYLHFIARLHKLSKPRQKVNEMIILTHLQREQNKKISSLSKGFRQRVGLAQAIIHDPKVLILDEPTSGLDPNQLVDIRNLIRQLGRDRTVIFSTHIMQEVTALCNKVIIINQGKLVANDSIETLTKKLQGQSQVTIEIDKNVDQKIFSKIPGAINVNKLQEKKYLITANPNNDIRPLIYQHSIENNYAILSMQLQELTVENIFQQLTKPQST